MDNFSHIFEKEGKRYEMVMEKAKNREIYLVLADNVLIKQKHQESAVTPTILTFFQFEHKKRTNITEIIDEKLKSEIIEDYWEMATKNLPRSF